MESKKVHAKLKTKPEDFIVEEIKENWYCKVTIPFESKQIDKIPENENNHTFLLAEMEKYDLDHFQAMKELTTKLNISPRNLGYAGTKDKAAITSQRISIENPNLEKLKEFSHPKINLKNFKWNKRKIKMGYLDANHFRIVLRDVDKTEAMKISNQIKKISFFPNYFGPQRFGSRRNNNVKIGKLILKREWKKAIETILFETSQNERRDITFSREKLAKSKNYLDAAKYFPHELKLEKQILFSLSRKPEDYLNALKYSDRKNILFYINSVQSKIFNEILEIALDENIDFDKECQKNCILVGYKSRFSKGRLGEIEQQVLQNNNLKLEDFNIQEIPYLRIKGSFRKAITKIIDLKIIIEDDEIFPPSKKMILEFSLPSGVYATTFLDNFFEFD